MTDLHCHSLKSAHCTFLFSLPLAAGVARHQQRCHQIGLPGFSIHRAEGGRSATAHFLELLLRRLLLEDMSQVG